MGIIKVAMLGFMRCLVIYCNDLRVTIYRKFSQITIPAGISGGGETISQMQRMENGAQAKMNPEALIRVNCPNKKI